MLEVAHDRIPSVAREDWARLMWITVDVERVLRVDRGINVILCERMPGPQTLVLKLKEIEMTNERRYTEKEVTDSLERVIRDMMERGEISDTRLAPQYVEVTPATVKAVQNAKCFACGAFTYEDCKRHPQRDCGREFQGGSRASKVTRPAPQAAPTREEFLPRDAWNELVDKDDRTSPEEYPDMCLISFDELKDYMERHTVNQPQPTSEMVSDLVAGLKYVAEFPVNNSQRQHAQQVLGRFASQLTRPHGGWQMSYCDCDYDGDAPSFFSQGVVKARKPHRCDECYGPIAKGESYKRSSGKWDGRVDTYAECEACMELRQWAEISVTCFCCNVFGQLHETVTEMVDDIRRDIPGFMFEWGRRIIKIERRRYGHWPRQAQRLGRRAARRAASSTLPSHHQSGE